MLLIWTDGSRVCPSLGIALSAKRVTTSQPGPRLSGYAIHNSNVQLAGRLLASPGGGSHESTCIGVSGWSIVVTYA